MATIKIEILQSDIYEEVEKATDYTGSKMIAQDEGARDRILAGSEDLSTLTRFWDESVAAANEKFKEMLISGGTTTTGGQTKYALSLEVSKAFDVTLIDSVKSALRSFFVHSIVGQWFKFSNKQEASDCFTEAAEMLQGADRILYSRKRPTKPND